MLSEKSYDLRDISQGWLGGGDKIMLRKALEDLLNGLTNPWEGGARMLGEGGEM